METREISKLILSVKSDLGIKILAVPSSSRVPQYYLYITAQAPLITELTRVNKIQITLMKSSNALLVPVVEAHQQNPNHAYYRFPIVQCTSTSISTKSKSHLQICTGSRAMHQYLVLYNYSSYQLAQY